MESYAIYSKYAIIFLIAVISLLQPSYGRPIPGVPLEEPTRDVFRKKDDDHGWGVTPQEPKPTEADVYTSPGVTPQEQLTTPIADVYASWGVTPQKHLKPTEAVVSTTNTGFEAFDALLGSNDQDEDDDEEPDDYNDSDPRNERGFLPRNHLRGISRSLGEDENDRDISPRNSLRGMSRFLGEDENDRDISPRNRLRGMSRSLGEDENDGDISPENRLEGMVHSLGEDENNRDISPEGDTDELKKRIRGMIRSLVGDENEKTSPGGDTDGPKNPLGGFVRYLIKEKNARNMSPGKKTDGNTKYLKEMLRSIEASTDNEHLAVTVPEELKPADTATAPDELKPTNTTTAPDELKPTNTATAPDKDYETTTRPPWSPEGRKLREKKTRFLNKIKSFFNKEAEPEEENPDLLQPQFENIAPVRPPKSANELRSLTDDLKQEMFLIEEKVTKHGSSTKKVSLAFAGSSTMMVIIIILLFLYRFRKKLTWKKSDVENDEEDSLEEQENDDEDYWEEQDNAEETYLGEQDWIDSEQAAADKAAVKAAAPRKIGGTLQKISEKLAFR